MILDQHDEEIHRLRRERKEAIAAEEEAVSGVQSERAEAEEAPGGIRHDPESREQRRRCLS